MEQHSLLFDIAQEAVKKRRHTTRSPNLDPFLVPCYRLYKRRGVRNLTYVMLQGKLLSGVEIKERIKKNQGRKKAKKDEQKSNKRCRERVTSRAWQRRQKVLSYLFCYSVFS
ncbi:hypothetical protein ES332_D04G132500v1 [Gossypium tomentosum]|uniref:Uncharacterized protein n=1 Tax=Gossypium tomentosum TaxID=34277 RepID=A0A5D2LDB4_GOSTO|nr:hypothetical protein ES332_D04G132500v1 [Gossypium tomentosum]